MVKIRTSSDIFSSTNALKVFSFLVAHPNQLFLGGEIQKATSLSRAGIYVALGELSRLGFIMKTKKGRFLMYQIVHHHPAVKQFKVLLNVCALEPLLSRLKFLSGRVILFGSVSRGEDTPESDVDLCVISHQPAEARRAIDTARTKRKIQPVIQTPSQWAELREKDPVFYGEVMRGIVLWEDRR